MPIECALLSVSANNWFHDLLLVAPGLHVRTLHPQSIGLGDAPNPYGLPLVDRTSVVLVDTRWYKWLRDHGRGNVESVFRRLERAAERIVGVEGYDTVRLGAPPDALDRVDFLLKAQGVYKDRELYNYRIGPYFPGGNWTVPLRREDRQYSSRQLEKVRLSLPCFVGVDRRVRRRVRQHRDGIRPTTRLLRACVDLGQEIILSAASRRRLNLATFIGALSHAQRLDLVKTLRSAAIPGDYGITGVPEYIFGLGVATEPVDSIRRRELIQELTDNGLLVPRRSRYRIGQITRRSLLTIAPAGYGELTFRHAEAWSAGSALLCQDLSHIETMFPFRADENVIYCRPDLGDLVDRVREAESNASWAEKVAQSGKQAWSEWIRPVDGLLRRGLTSHLELT